MQLSRIVLLVMVLLLVSPKAACAPEYVEPKPVERPRLLEVIEVSRGEPEPTIERRVMRVTAYTAHDEGMDGRGITASGEMVKEGRTIAAPPELAFGTEIYIPALEHSYTVTDRGGAIQGDRLDLYIEDLDRALQFGVQDLEVWIYETG